MNVFFDDSITAAAAWMVVKASVILLATAVVQVFLSGRTSSAVRHLLWTLAVGAVLVLPLLSYGLPEWTLTVRQIVAPLTPGANAVAISEAPAVPDSPTLDPSTAPPPPIARAASAFSWPIAAAAVYVAGLVAILMHLAVQRWRVGRLVRDASELQSVEWQRLVAECAADLGCRSPVRLLRSCHSIMPMAFGIRNAAIVLPAVADLWPDDRRRAVVLHELAHVVRRDCLTQGLARVACAVYWFHPAIWWVAKQLRIERELACDDRVIASGTRPRDYAAHLLEIAYSFGGDRAPALAVSMASPRQLEGRMLAALDDARNRRLPAARLWSAGVVLGALVLVPIACARPTVVVAETTGERAHVHQLDPHLKAHSFTVLDGTASPLSHWLRRVTERVKSTALGFVQDGLPGTWELRPTNTQGTVHLRLVELNSSNGADVRLDQLEGLAAAQLTSGGQVQFRLQRDAGTFAFEGVVRSGVGAGTFSFVPNPTFATELTKRGFARPTDREQYQLARHDIGYAFIDELNRQGYTKPDTSELVRAGQHGVHVRYLREMGELGYRLRTLGPLITLRDHGVDPTYVRDLAALGYKQLPADDIRKARDHGVSAEFVRGMRDAGFGSLPMEDLITARDHGVSPEFVRALADAGHRQLGLDQIVRARDHGVSPEFAREMRQMGYQVRLDELITARDHGVSTEFAREMSSLGYGTLPIESLVRLRDHGVSSEFVRELKSLGYDRLPIDDLVSLRDHGVSAERIRAANARAGTRLPIDLLRSLHR
jgi:beta-lactamase regulating signal transducer with metallopeptidase domain